MCSRPEVAALLRRLAGVAAEALTLGVKVVVDVEPVVYESAVGLLSALAACSRDSAIKGSVLVKEAGGAAYRFSVAMNSVPSPAPDEVVLAVSTKRRADEILADVEAALSTDNVVYALVVPQRPDVQFSAAIYAENLVLDAVKGALGDLYEATKDEGYAKRLGYAGRLPHGLVLFGDADRLAEAAARWSPPPPAYAGYLKKRPRALDELLLPKGLLDAVRGYLRLVKRVGQGSVALIGLPGSGRKTLAAAMARELGVPAYYISLSNVLGKFVGESEGKLAAFFASLRARGASLAVFDGVEALFKRSGSEEVQANLLNILTNELSRDDNNFVVAFTVRENAKSEVLGSAVLGELKLVMPLPRREERRALARQFFREVASLVSPDALDRLRGLAGRGEGADSVLEDAYVEPFVDVSAGMTPGELYRSMRRILLPAIEDSLAKGRLVPVADEAVELARRNLAAREAQVRELIQRAVELGETDVADALLDVYAELSSKSRERQAKASKYNVY